MKHLSAFRFALALIVPLLLAVLAMVMPLGGCGGSSGSPNTPLPTTGNLQVGFVLDPTTPANSGYKSIMLNVISVRVNPSTVPVADNDVNWQTVPVPVGNTSGEVQIDLNTLSSQPQLFNTAAIPPQTYFQVEVLVDPIEGNVVPACPSSSSFFEGCTTFGLVFPAANPTSMTTPFEFSYKSGGLAVNANATTTLILQFNPGMITPPSSPSVSTNFTASDASITPENLPASSVSVVSGSVSNFVATSSTPPQTVTAELSGTDNVIATTKVQQVSGSLGMYSLALPAPSDGSGTLYDLYVSGGGGSIQAIRGVLVSGGGKTATENFTNVTQASTGSITGNLISACNSAIIQGATVQALLPPESVMSPPADFCMTAPSACVSVASGNSDEAGNYPLPGTAFNPAPLSVLPLLPSGQQYVLKVTASGFDPLLSPATLNAGFSGPTGICPSPPNINPGTSTNSDCSFALGAGFIRGVASIDVAPKAPVQGLLMAEQSGTLNVAGMTMITINPGSTTTPFTVQIPDSSSGATSYDLFDSTLDFFNNAPAANSGHTIGVFSGVPAPAFCATASATPTMETMDCAGHSSVTGTLASSNAYTSVQLAKMAPNNMPVQLMTSQVGLTGTFASGAFAFCAPPDTYTLQTYQAPLPASGGPVPVPVPTGSPTAVTLPAPMATATPPCPLCANATGACPGTCSGLTGVVITR